jgi:hypothetical protein
MQRSAIAGTRAEQPDADLGTRKGRQTSEKSSNRVNAFLCVALHKTIISNSYVKGDCCQLACCRSSAGKKSVMSSNWTPPTPTTSHLERC